MKTEKLFVIFLCIALLFLSGCAKSIEEVKQDKYIDEKVTVKGTVENTVKIGEISGYTLTDETGSIAVSSKELPEEGKAKTATGILKKNLLLGYYVEVN